VINGGGQVINQFANGWGDADIAIQYAGRSYAIELKIKENQRSEAESPDQLLRYMDHLLTKEGWLVVFDRESSKSWREKLTWETKILSAGRVIHVVGC
jgi:hypothetical protein